MSPLLTATRIHLTCAASMGFAGVALLAAAAHVPSAESAQTAGQMLLFHAPVIIAATAARRADLLHDIIGRLAASVLILGVALFAIDLARRGFGGARLFVGAAPAGGFLMLGGWLGLVVASLFAKRA